MIIRELVDILIRSVSGGNNGSDGKYEPRYIESIIPHLRERAIKMEYNGSRIMTANRRVDYAWLNKAFTVPKDAAIQDPEFDFIVFAMPKPSSINKIVDGFIYVGQKNNAVSFKKMTSREDIANAIERGFLRNGRDIAYIWQAPYLEVYGDKSLKEVNVRMICADPLQAPGFNPEVDEYPVTESVIANMVELFKQEMSVDIQKPADTIVDSADTLSRAMLTQNVRS